MYRSITDLGVKTVSKKPYAGRITAMAIMLSIKKCTKFSTIEVFLQRIVMFVFSAV